MSRYTCHASRASHRDRHGLVTVGSHLYAVGGSRSIGSERSIEMFDGTEWVEVGETDGFRWGYGHRPSNRSLMRTIIARPERWNPKHTRIVLGFNLNFKLVF